MPAASHANRVRIIAGRFRGRSIRFPPVPGLRPTPDRVRETLFNWLGQTLSGQRTLDLYAGSGALSLEAVSRGAALAVAVDHDPKAVRALEATAREFGAAELEGHVAAAEAYVKRESRTFDVIFLDPPFGSSPFGTLLPACVARLAPGGSIYVEAGTAIDPPTGLEVWRRDRAGQVHYHLLRAAAG